MNTFFLYILYTIYYYTIYIYIVTTYYLTIYILLNQSLTKVVISFFVVTTPYYFFTSKIMLHRCILYRFSVLFAQKSKKICQFFAIFSRCVSMIYEKFEKKVAQNS